MQDKYYGLYLRFKDDNGPEISEILITQELPTRDGTNHGMKVARRLSSTSPWEILMSSVSWSSAAAFSQDAQDFTLDPGLTYEQKLNIASHYAKTTISPMVDRYEDTEYTLVGHKFVQLSEDTKNKLVDGAIPIDNFMLLPSGYINTPYHDRIQASIDVSFDDHRGLIALARTWKNVAPYFVLLSALTSDQPSLDYVQSLFVYDAASVTPSTPPIPETPLTDFYTRPNGQKYYPRRWNGQEDVKVLHKARENSMSPFFTGPPGTGKTALCEAAFGEELLTVVMTGDTEVTDLVGSFIPKTDGSDGYEWVDGPLLVAVREGRPILLDEIALGDPKVLSTVYPLMDGRDEFNVTSNPAIGVVKAKKGFFVLGATNPRAPGANMSKALLSRFDLHVEITTDWRLAVRVGVPADIVRVAESVNRNFEANELSWAPQFRELLQYRDIKDIFDQDFALANLLAMCPEDDRETVSEIISRSMRKRVFAARI